jgi:peptidoglycan/xylan/chitin deacetylase (PgdA/CDA1 family)
VPTSMGTHIGTQQIRRSLKRRGKQSVDLVAKQIFESSVKVPGLPGRLAGGAAIATVFHQIIDERRPNEATAFCNELRPDFHAIVEFIASLHNAKKETDLWITFDDGYAAAAEVLDEIAPAFPAIQFVYFVCPQKTSARVGYRWDSWEQQHDHPSGPPEFVTFARGPVTLEENSRLDLREAAADERFRLATVEQCRALTRHSNVALGNHTNRHIELTTMSDSEAEAEIRDSTNVFSELFGIPKHFAFPYGTPGVSYNDAHVALLRSLGYQYLWSTEAMGFSATEAHSITIPRIPINGLRTVDETKANITKYLLKTQISLQKKRIIQRFR